ncbi:MAG TPA: hypothetical protein VGF25_21300 [Thermoleophilaceae bacterium]
MRDSGGVGLAVTGLGAAAAVLMAVTEFTTIVSVDVANGSCAVINDADPELAEKCTLSGFERHSVVFVLLAVFVLVMAVGAGIGRSRPAAVALVALGLVALGIALLSDLPASDETGAIGRNFEGATASAGAGLWLEIAAGALAVLAGAVRLARPDG